MQARTQFNPVNLLGALSVAASDRILAAASSEIGHGGETGAALVAIGHAAGLSNDQLGRALGLSHPGTVRLVDRLVAAGLVERRDVPGDRRAVALHLTRAGETRRAAILAVRDDALAGLLAPLNAGERVQLAALCAKMLEALPEDRWAGLGICRLCDERQCPHCPVDAGMEAAGG